MYSKSASRCTSVYADDDNPRRKPIGNSVGSLMQPDFHDAYQSPRPVPRVGMSTIAAAMVRLSHQGTITSCMQQQQQQQQDERKTGNVAYVGCGIVPGDSSSGSANQQLMRRVIGQLANEIQERHDGSSMAAVLNADENRDYESPRPRPRLPVGGLGEEIASRHSGSSMDRVLDVDANRGYSSARRQPRVGRGGGEEAARRNTGGSAMLAALDHAANRDYFSAPDPRVKGDAGEENYGRSRSGTVGLVMNEAANVDYSSPRPAQRVPAERGRGLAVQLVLDAAANRDYRSPRPAVKVRSNEGREIAARGEHGTMSTILHQDDAARRGDASTPIYESRVKPEARDIALAGRQGTFGMVLEGRLPASPAGGLRVKSGEGADNYERGCRGSLGAQMADYGRLPLSSRPASRVRDDGGPIAEHGQAGTVNQLFYDYGHLPRSARPEPRIRPEAKRNAVRNMGTMADFMS